MLDEITCFVNWVRRRNPQAHTWQDYRCDLQQFVTVVGDKPPAEIQITDIDDFINEQNKCGLHPATINRRLAAVTSLYTFLQAEEPELLCPVLPQRHTLRAPRRLPRAVPETDLHAFFDVIEDRRDQAIFLLMLRCGLRISEVASLQLQDLYLNEAQPRLQIMGKNSKERSVYLSNQAETALRRYLNERAEVEETAVFLNYRHEPLAAIGIHKRLERYRRLAGIHITAHQLRHNFANDLVCADVPVTSIQQLMGHAWIATTETYLAANNPKVKADFYAAVEQLAGWQHG